MASQNRFRPPDPQANFVELEKGWLKHWYAKGLVEKYLHRNDKSSKRFSFLDGPITANNPMGVHHAWGRTYKDLWQRFYNMRGCRQRFQNGFDCQGLWVEVQVEKELGLKSKKDIENLVPGNVGESIAKFVQLCKDRVYKYAQIQTEQSKRLGYFMDWDNSYFTLSDENNYMIWTFLKKCHEKGLIYKGRDSVPWCPRCGTAISQHEMLTEDYKEVNHDSVYVRYPVVGEDGTYLMIWTTTPWTLPANVAVAVDPGKDYAVVDNDGLNYVGKAFAERKGQKIEKVVKGSELVGKKYSSPCDDLPRIKEAIGDKTHEVIAADPLFLTISDEEGTGLVHIAPGAGTEDFQLGKKYSLSVIDVIDEEAKYIDGLGELSGKNAKEDPQFIIDQVIKAGALFYIEQVTHRYPACWRCHSELVWRVVDEWYIAMDPLREPMKKVAKKINWIPEFGLKRELDWLANMHDWLISKKRYWGLALPIWECRQCGDFQVIGGKEELEAKAIEGWDKFAGNSPHRPWVDGVKIRCQKCDGVADRIPDVGNPWLDAGIVPFSTVKEENKGEPLYWQDKKQWGSWYPADFITESFPGQFKNWFYSLIAMSTVFKNREPFKTVLGFATLFGEDGRPMHKTSGNMIEFDEGADKIGVDVMRWVYARQDVADNLLFGYTLADQVRRSFHLILWNVYNFFVVYANAGKWDAAKISRSQNGLDKWIKARISQTINTVTDSLEKYDAKSAAFVLEGFVQDLSLWYVRRSRDRVGAAADNTDRKICLTTLYDVLVDLSKLLAPFTPFLAEEIYTNLIGGESVHLSSWPKYSKLTEEQKALLGQMAVAREVVEQGHTARKFAGLPVRQPLSQMRVVCSNELLDDQVLQLIKDELNVKKIVWKVDVNVVEPWVKLNTKITPRLEEEGKTRELARKIQEERKILGVTLDEKVRVVSSWLPTRPELLEWLRRRTLAEQLEKGKELQVNRLE